MSCISGLEDFSLNVFLTFPLFSGNLQLNEWQHVAFVWDKEALKGSYYINGVLTGEKLANPDNGYGYDLVSNNHAKYDIGLKRDTRGYFLGYLRDLMIIEHALSANEIICIFSSKSCSHLHE